MIRYPVVVLCGGRGMRLRERTDQVPKPMVKVGEMPILWHIMMGYAAAGFREFILCLGYRGEVIREFFADPRWEWNVAFSDAGEDAETGERLRQARDLIGGARTFLATYGDNVSDVSAAAILAAHHATGRAATVTCVRARTTFGIIDATDGLMTAYREKPFLDLRVNGGFYCFDQRVFDYIQPGEALEREPIQRLVADRQLTAHHHDGFWACMDTLKDNQELCVLWERGAAPWKVW